MENKIEFRTLKGWKGLDVFFAGGKYANGYIGEIDYRRGPTEIIISFDENAELTAGVLREIADKMDELAEANEGPNRLIVSP